MPYHRVIEKQEPADQSLVAEVVAELQANPTETDRIAPVTSRPVEAPEIIEEETPRGPLHVTVVWDKWPHLSPEARGRVILEAYKQAQGEERMRRISIALGVTSEQADRLRLFRK